jgi:enoyl-CoA hydratase/carnithine racemase
MRSYETIRYAENDGVGRLALARPAKRNAQNPRMWAELRDLGARLATDVPSRCFVVTGEGPSFSAGIDLVEGLGNLTTTVAENQNLDEAVNLGLRAAGSFSWIPKLPCATLAMVQGHAYGAGLQLALSCDFRVFTESAQVGLREIRYGILPDMGACWRLPHMVGEGRAKEMILLGKIVGASEALEMGLANEVIPDESLAERTDDWTAQLASLPPVAVSGAKRLLASAWKIGEEEAQVEAVHAQLECLRSNDFREGLAAHAERRDPVWTGS